MKKTRDITIESLKSLQETLNSIEKEIFDLKDLKGKDQKLWDSYDKDLNILLGKFLDIDKIIGDLLKAEEKKKTK